MLKNEFMEYLKYLNKTIDVKPPSDKETLQAWYEPYKNIPINLAKEMAKEYLKHETGFFKYAKLLSYKDKVFREKAYRKEEKINQNPSCPLCGDTGFVQIDIEGYIMCRKCMCKASDGIPSFVRQITENDIDKLKKISNLIYILE
ncbi:hypothetical protein [Clostridium sporogenes]|uniref:hypothetical protein n=1 Tax=Clostridium sporogenes TaxID=1509 RepID=UPI0013D2F788|nr:hypothetical protein [Clostridium sporogenes]NFP92384.1 hypothetical protein [Clostridium sporogenes]